MDDKIFEAEYEDVFFALEERDGGHDDDGGDDYGHSTGQGGNQ